MSSELPHSSGSGAASAETVSIASDSKVGRPITEPCGTLAAYRRHKRHGEDPCDECREVYNAAHRDYYAKRRYAV